MNRPNAQRGSIIIYAMLTMSAMLAIGVTLSGLFIGKLKSAAASRDSTEAIYAADSAVEMCLYEAREKKQVPPLADIQGVTYNPLPYTIVSTQAGKNVAINQVITDDCSVAGSASFGFRVTGQYRGVRRTLEISQ